MLKSALHAMYGASSVLFRFLRDESNPRRFPQPSYFQLRNFIILPRGPRGEPEPSALADPHAHRAGRPRPASTTNCSTSISPLARFAQSHAHIYAATGMGHAHGAAHAMGLGMPMLAPSVYAFTARLKSITCAPDLIPLPLAYLLRRARAIDLSYHAAASISASTSASMSA